MAEPVNILLHLMKNDVVDVDTGFDVFRGEISEIKKFFFKRKKIFNSRLFEPGKQDSDGFISDKSLYFFFTLELFGISESARGMILEVSKLMSQGIRGGMNSILGGFIETVNVRVSQMITQFINGFIEIDLWLTRPHWGDNLHLFIVYLEIQTQKLGRNFNRKDYEKRSDFRIF